MRLVKSTLVLMLVRGLVLVGLARTTTNGALLARKVRREREWETATLVKP